MINNVLKVLAIIIVLCAVVHSLPMKRPVEESPKTIKNPPNDGDISVLIFIKVKLWLLY